MKKPPVVFVIKNNLIQDMIFHLRSIETYPEKFRDLIKKITFFLTFEAMKDSALVETEVSTPNGKFKDKKISDKPPFIVSILRAAEVMAFSMLELIPKASICHIGIGRNEETLMPEQYLALKTTEEEKERQCFVVDVMLATGGSASYTISLLKEKGVNNIKLLCIFAAKRGIGKIRRDHPDVQIYCAVVDPKLNSVGYIVPGCGDAGKRSFGTTK